MPYPLITDMGIHHFDLLRYVLAREPLSVYARTWNPPWGWHAGDAGHAVIIEFEGGLEPIRKPLPRPLPDTERGEDTPFPRREGGRGVRFSDRYLIATHHALGSSTGKQSPWNGEWRIEGPKGSLTWEENQIFLTRAYPSDQRVREEMPLDALPLSGQDALLAEFLAAVREGREPECSGQDNLKSLAIVFAAIRSSKEKRTVEIAEVMDSK